MVVIVMKENYAYIDYLKLFFCFCVVGIHSEIFYNFDNIIDYTVFHAIFRCAVPFFFIVTGFFFGIKIYKANSLKEKNQIINKYLKRLIIPYLFWLIIGSIKVYLMLDGSVIIRLVKLLRLAILNPWTALWYIWVVILFLVIYKILLNITKDKINIRKLITISYALYIFALLCNNYYFLIENTYIQDLIDLYMKVFITPRNIIFLNIFMLTGMYFAKYKNVIKNIKINRIVIVSTLSFVVLILETLLLKDKSFVDDSSLYISFLVFIPSLFILMLKFKSNKDTTLIRNLSTGIYFMHCITLTLLRFVIFNNYLLFISAIIIDIVILLLLYKINNKYINYLIK